MPCPSESIAFPARCPNRPRHGALGGALASRASALLRRFAAWREANRRAFEAARWLQSASDRDLADIGLAPRVPGIRGAPGALDTH